MAREAPKPLFTKSSADGAFVAAPSCRGPWDPAMMHGGAPSALLARAVETLEPGAGELSVARLTIEFLGGVPVGEVAVAASLAKPGRRLQFVDAALDAGGRRACLARAVRLRREEPRAQARALPPGMPAALPPPEDGEPWPMFVDHDREYFYPDATEIVQVAGRPGSGACAAWIRLRGELVPGERPSPLARAVATADFTNGLSWILPFDEWLFVNTELTVHLWREAAGEWIGLDAQTISGGAGIGLSTGVLHDLDGPIGVCAQALYVAPR